MSIFRESGPCTLYETRAEGNKWYWMVTICNGEVQGTIHNRHTGDVMEVAALWAPKSRELYIRASTSSQTVTTHVYNSCVHAIHKAHRETFPTLYAKENYQ